MALKALNSVGGFSVGESPNVVIAANGDFSGNKANFVGNVAVLGVLTDNYYYANGAPLDFELPSGANTQVQFNDSGDFGASANFTFNSATNVLTVTGNIVVSDTANVGNLRTDNLLYANGDPWDLQEAAGANTQIQYNQGDDFAASANLTYDDSTQQFTVLGNANVTALNTTNVNSATDLFLTANGFTLSLFANGLAEFEDGIFSTGNINAGNANVGNLLQANFAEITSNIVAENIAVNSLISASTANFTGNIAPAGILTDNYYYANGAPVDFQQPAGANTQIQFNNDDDFGASANLTFDTATDTLTTVNANITTVNSSNLVGTGTDVTINANGFVTTFYGANGLVNIVGPLSGNTATFSGNISAQNADLGNLATANFVSVSSNVVTENLTVNSALSGATANFSGNIEALNADLGNLAVANYVNVANELSVTGNVSAANFVGPLANGTSNVRVFNGANVEVSVAGNANVLTVTGTGVRVAGNINSTTGNILANGNITANGFLVSANANISGEAEIGSIVTDTITAPTGNLAFNAAGSDSSISLVPTGNGTVDVSNFRITQVADPVNPLDATNKSYVDALAGEGLVIHSPVRVEADSPLSATYAQGGTTPTVVSIANGTDITFSATHGLSVNDGIVFDNTFNGLTGGEAYWVADVVDTTTITVKDDYTGSAVTGLTNGTGLTQASRANPGVGATLTNSGANAALTIDGVALSTSDRVLVYTQANSEENGIYTVTTVGDGSTAWVLTRATDFNKYIPGSSLGVAKNSYVFVSEGLTGAGESYVMTEPSGEIIIGTDGLTFTQFSAAGAYTAGDGIDITGTVISANTDGITTAIVDGNVVVKANAQLTTPNIGAATGTSLNVTGNVSANNISVANVANVGLDLTVGGNIDANGTISSNANVSGLNFTTSGNVEASGDVIADNVSANTLLSAPTANVSGNVNAGVVNISGTLEGNTANFLGNVSAPTFIGNVQGNISGNITVTGANTEILFNDEGLAGTSNAFTFNKATDVLTVAGNVDFENADLGNLAVANFFTGTLINGTSNLVITENGNITLTAGGNSSFVVTDAGANVVGNIGVTDSLFANSVSVDTNVEVGNTNIGWGTLTTSAITANQTIAQFAVTGTTGVEFIVKGEDDTGAKYSVATVTAVTDGSNVDYSIYASASLGGSTGSLAVNIVGSNIALQVTPASSNSTLWTSQYRTI